MNDTLRDRRILVVDDDLDAAESLALLLSRIGADVHIAHDGASALAAAEWFDPRAILLDLTMPGMDGYQVAQHLRNRPGPSPMLVALTGWSGQEDRARSQEAGFDHHLVKPVDLGQLESVLATA